MKIIVVSGNGPALLGVPIIETLDILTITYNTIDMQTSGEQINRKRTDEWGFINKI